ncbi:GNAT family N-acetyltransferase [uncultured Roseibium sp.]|uniref:GNAT family N-acetyltransferase n=1 Tax=uncultured Roseibium sp. TaxID=1936171 RepID=UPI00261B119F|nr:GNAT family N-acetyltransferase [uncultured Roseibium sp.]
MNDRLNRVVWSALSSRQSRISKGGSLARRFDPEISPFAASKDNSAAALNALAALIGRNETPVFLLQAEQILLPDTLVAEKTALGVLMTERIAKTAKSHEFEISVLSDDDVPEMLALAELTKPGPFTSRTPELGTFLGVKLDGRLAAMGGTRLNLEGYTEISGLCTHPDYQGRGLASALTLQIAADIRGRGDTPFLHAYADNHGAIALYRNLGFEIWSEVNVAVVSRKS